MNPAQATNLSPQSSTSNCDLSFVPYIQAKSCAEVTHQNRSNFFSAFRFLSREKADGLMRVYAFFRIADDCVDELSNPNQQNKALDFWEEEIRKCYRNQTTHPVITDLKTTLTRFQIPESYFIGLIEGCRMDVTRTRYESFDELYEYCYRVAGLVGLTCIKIFEYESDTSEKMAVDLGLAFQLTNILRDIKGDLGLGRIYLPLEDLRKHNYSEAELMAGKHNENLVKLLTEYAGKAEHYYELAEEEFRKDTDNKLIAAKAMAKVYHRILRKITRQNFPVFGPKITIPKWQKALMMLPLLWSYLLKR